MAAAGDRTSFCEFLKPLTRSGLGEGNPDVSNWPVWAEAWGKKVGLRGGELQLARETQPQEIEDFWFEYVDLINPHEDGVSVSADMVIRVDDGTPGGQLYDIDAVFPDEIRRGEVRIRAVRKRLGV
jgi:hypothetical protein